MITWLEITKFGDVTVTLLVAIAIAAWLFAEGEKRLALWWGLLFLAGTGAVIATKMAFIGWGIGIRWLDFAGFSGHAMRTSAVMPVLLYLILQKTPPLVRTLGVVLGLAFGALVGASRLALHVHSLSEVVAGCVLGGMVSLTFIRLAQDSLRKHIFKPLRIALSLLVLLPAPYVHPAPTQQWLTEITLYVSGHERPFPRNGWKHGRIRPLSP